MEELTSSGKFCDFCGQPSDVVFDVPDFVMGAGIRSIAGWAACKVCEEMVRNRQKSDLLRRAEASCPEATKVGISVADLHERFWSAYTAHAFIAAKSLTPPWEQAVSAHMEALGVLDRIYTAHTAIDWTSKQEDLERLRDKLVFSQTEFKALTSGGDSVDILAKIMVDRHIMRAATTYAFSGDARNAIVEASKSIPMDAPLQVHNIPDTGNGFWWFVPPLDIPTTSDGEGIHGILWGVGGSISAVYPAGTPVEDVVIPEGYYLSFSVYSYAKTATGNHLMPNIFWKWRVGETVEQMLESVRTNHGVARVGSDGFSRIEPTIFDVNQVGNIVLQLSRFFLAACVWIEQEIVETTDGHIERHARKRYVKEHKLPKPPSVRVVALRKKRKSESSEAQPAGEPPKWSFRWVVGGHWRNQPYGVNRELRRLIYIMPFVKGPEGMPLREPRKKVFAVLR